MIIDTLDHYDRYAFGPAWEKAFAFLESLAPDVPLGRYEIDGEDIYANIEEYQTAEGGFGRYEAHRRYVDIQTLLSGTENLDWTPLPGPKSIGPYSEKKDVQFFHRVRQGTGSVTISRGLFAALFPEDAHMPGIAYGGVPAPVKKVVVKIRLDLLEESLG